MQISLGEAICQEFSDMVHSGFKLSESENGISNEVEEIKCCISMKYFNALMDRMDSAGYYMSQVQKDKSLKRCFIWFKHKSMY